jgi:hypothetical protein
LFPVNQQEIRGGFGEVAGVETQYEPDEIIVASCIDRDLPGELIALRVAWPKEHRWIAIDRLGDRVFVCSRGPVATALSRP